MKAIKVSPLSLTIPFLSFTPVFMILTGFLVLGEVPNKWGVFGIGFVVAGSYALHSAEVTHGYLAPFRAIFKEPGSWLMLIVSLLYSVLAVLGKKAIQHSSPVFFGFFFTNPVSVRPSVSSLASLIAVGWSALPRRCFLAAYGLSAVTVPFTVFLR